MFDGKIVRLTGTNVIVRVYKNGNEEVIKNGKIIYMWRKK